MVNASSENRPKRLVKYSATLLVVALLAYAAFLVAQSWREAKFGQAGQLSTVAALSANSLDIYLGQLQIGMQSLGEDLDGTRSKPDLDRAFTLVKRFQALHTELGNVMLMRGDGQVLLTGTTPNRPDMPTLAGDPVFEGILGELQQAGHFAIGRPILGNIDQSWVVSARYAVADRAGKLLYIISANLPADMLQRYRVDSTTPRISVLGLLRDDGYLVGRYPAPDVASMDQMFGKPAEGAMADYLRANKHQQEGQIEIRDGGGRTTGMLVMRRLQHYPLTLFVELPMSEIRAAWWQDIHAPYFMMALVLACSFVFFSLKRRRRAWSEAQRRAELQRRYEETLKEGSPNEIFMFDAVTLQIIYANNAALDNLGATLAQLQNENILSLHPELGIEAIGAMIEPLRRGEERSITYRTVQAREDGSTYPVEVNLQLIEAEDGGERFLAVINDLTALQQAEEHIRKFNAPAERRITKVK